VGAVKAHYAGDAGQIEADVVRLIAELEAEGLVVPAGSEGGTAAPAGVSAACEPAPAYEATVLKRYEDMHDLLLLDPIHEVDEMGWPNVKPAPGPVS